MKYFFARRRRWPFAAAAILAMTGIIALMPAALDAGYFRGALIHYLEAHFHRQIRIEGPLRLRLWSRHPRIVAERVTIGNPPWAAPGVETRGLQAPGEMARIGRLTLTYSAPGFGGGAALESVILEDTSLHLMRNAAGHANWQQTESLTRGNGLPLIKELLAEGAHVVLDDQLRHLQFEGIVSARGLRQVPPQRLHIEGTGRLNGRPTSFDLSADALDSTRRGAAYAWEFAEQSSGSRVTVHGSLPQPFDFNVLNAAFDASGEDLRDLYFLTGVTLVNTGPYRLTGSVQRRGTETRFTQLHLHSGQSDLDGTLSIVAVNDRSHLDGDLNAKLLRTSDFGARAAGRASPAEASPHFFSTAAFNPETLRRTDTLLRFRAQQLDVGRLALQSIAGQMKIDRGVVTVTPLTADLLRGRVEARIRVDANQDVPTVEASMRFSDLQLAALNHEDAETAPLEGLMQVRIDVGGQGRSMHQVAATANGNVNATLPRGKIRASLAEIAGVDLRGIGLTLTHSRREAEVRCAAASFEARDGTLTARSIVIDTAPVEITGEGDIRLSTEELNLRLRGQPKDLRVLRLDAPLLLQGTLTRPSIGIQTHESSVKLIDRGNGKDVDCAALLGG